MVCIKIQSFVVIPIIISVGKKYQPNMFTLLKIFSNNFNLVFPSQKGLFLSKYG